MNEFKFNGDWEFSLKLNEFSKLKAASKTQYEGSDLTQFKIIDYRSYDPDPLAQQIAAINFIINNEAAFIESILLASHNINAHYIERSGEDDWIPKPLNVESLGQLLSIGTISILTEHKDNVAYIQMDCGYKGDEEHGLTIVMHKHRLIGHDLMFEMDYACVYADLGKEVGEVFRNGNIKSLELGKDQIHKALDKYGKLKPWQKQATEDYLSDLLRKKENDTLKKIIEEEAYNFNDRIYYKDRNLVDIAAYRNNIEMIDYLIGQGADFSRSIFECTGAYIKKDIIECLVGHGANIDELGTRRITALQHEITRYVSSLDRSIRYKENAYQYESAQKELEDHKDKLCFYIRMGANPNNCDTEGNNYKQVLLKRWKETFLSTHNVIAQIEQLIAENSNRD